VPVLEVCIIGAGAVGGLLAAAALEAGCSVRLYSRRSCTLTVRGPPHRVRVEALGTPWPPAVCDYAILAVKAYSTREALEYMAAYRVRAPMLLVVQNGLGGLEYAESAYPGLAAAGVADFGSLRRGCTVERRGAGRLVAGCRGLDCRAELAPLARCLALGGLQVRLASDIEPHRWLKLAVNAAINTITALLRIPNGEVAENPWLSRLASRIASLVEAEAMRRGIRLPRPAAEEALRVARETGWNRSSTLQDLEAGRPTEVDWILGPLASPGSLLEPLYLALKGAEEIARRGPGLSH